MPTKPELEAEVEQLKQQLTANQNPDLVAIQAELDKLKADLQQVADERDALQVRIAGWDQAEKEYQTIVADLTEKLQRSDQAREDVQQKMEDLVAQDDRLVMSLRANIEELSKKTPDCDGDHVRLDGERYRIVWRSTVKDLSIEGYQKRNLDENHTAVVVEKHGG